MIQEWASGWIKCRVLKRTQQQDPMNQEKNSPKTCRNPRAPQRNTMNREKKKKKKKKKNDNRQKSKNTLADNRCMKKSCFELRRAAWAVN